MKKNRIMKAMVNPVELAKEIGYDKYDSSVSNSMHKIMRTVFTLSNAIKHIGNDESWANMKEFANLSDRQLVRKLSTTNMVIIDTCGKFIPDAISDAVDNDTIDKSDLEEFIVAIADIEKSGKKYSDIITLSESKYSEDDIEFVMLNIRNYVYKLQWWVVKYLNQVKEKELEEVKINAKINKKEEVIKLDAKAPDAEVRLNAKAEDIEIEELRESVSALDNEAGNVVVECDEEKYTEFMDAFKLYMRSTLANMNKIPLSEVLTNGRDNKIIDFSNREFRDTTLIFNPSALKKEFKPNSKFYNIRFATMLQDFIMRHFDKLVYNQSCKTNGVDNPTFGMLYETASYVSGNVIRASINLLKGKLGGLKEVIDTIIITKSADNGNDKIFDMYDDGVSILLNGKIETEDGQFKMTDAYYMDYLCKTAYVVMAETNVFPDDMEFKIPEDFTFKNTKAVFEVLENIGELILNRVRTTNEVANLYKIFSLCNPQLHYKFPEVHENENLNAGCRAISFITYLINDKEIDKLSKKICVA